MNAFSVVVLTLNEERNLAQCLQSARGCDNLVVLDSGSTDRTAEVARDCGAQIVVNPFLDFAQQRNFAHTSIHFRHPWLFHLDADEQLTPELIEELNTIAGTGRTDVDGFWVAPRMIYRGRWIPHCTDFPAYQARFVRPDSFRFIQVGHGQREAPEMRMARVAANYLHDLSADGEQALVDKHRRYAKQEAHAHLSHAPTTLPGLRSMVSGSALERRRALKALSQRLPARGPLRFVYQYVLRRGFLDGQPGLAYCLLMARYEHWIGREIRVRSPHAHVRPLR